MIIKGILEYNNKQYNYVVLSDVTTASGARFGQLDVIEERFLLANDDSLNYYNLDYRFYDYLPAELIKSGDEVKIKEFIRNNID